MRNKEHYIFVAAFALLVIGVFNGFLAGREVLLSGDYLQQFYPWYSAYADNLKQGHLTLWLKDVQCGYPLFAEGQIGQLYPLNLLFFFVLPFKLAYNWSFLFHFILSGVLTYFFTRRKGASGLGGAVSAFLVCFGSMYAGCFVNTSALKSLAWFPLVLIFLELHFEKKNIKYLFASGLVIGMQLLAGAAQMTFYALIFYVVYFIFYAVEAKRSFASIAGSLIVMSSMALLIALPQLSETFLLSSLSNRSSWTLEFALWNSFMPLTIVGAFMPYLGMVLTKGGILYISVVGLFYAGFYMFSGDKDRSKWPLVLMLLLSVLLALGKYNPLYVMVVKTFKVFSLRAPSRFMYFGVFVLSSMAGIGFTQMWNRRKDVPRYFFDAFTWLLSLVLAAFVSLKIFMAFLGAEVLELGKQYVAKNIYGKPLHRYDLSTYLQRTEEFYNSLQQALSLKNVYVLEGVLFVVAAIALIAFIKRSSGKRADVFLRYASLVFITVELAAFSSYSRGVWPEIKKTEYSMPAGDSRIFSELKKDSGFFRVCPFGDFDKMPAWIRPSMNAVYGVSSVAFYTPLINSDYFAMMKGITIVDDSVGIFPCEQTKLSASIDLLRRLGVGYIVSTQELDIALLEKVCDERGAILYKLSMGRPHFVFIEKDGSYLPGAGNVEVNKDISGLAELKLEANSAGSLVYSEKSYPGWEAYVDGVKTEISKTADLTQSIEIMPGKHDVRFRYRPRFFYLFLPLSVIIFAGTIIFLVFGKDKRRGTSG